MFAGYMRDITERRRNEAALAEYTRDLEVAHETQRQNSQQLATLVDQLRLTQRRAEDATRAKSDFLASMSHELRTPLNAIILYSELLQEVSGRGRRNNQSITDLQKIQSAGKHLLALINGILDLSKIEAGKMGLSRESFDVREMIDELLDTVGPLVRKNNNTLTVRCGEDVGDDERGLMKTRQILINLLSNAGKFTRDGAVTLEVGRRAEGARVLIEFTRHRHRRRHDRGADGKDLRRVHAGRRDDDPKIRRHWIGIGARVAFLRADERIRVGRKPAWGRIAVHRATSAGGRACRGACGNRSMMDRRGWDPVATILVVEDNEASRDALARRLERQGYRVLLAVDGRQGFRWRAPHCRISF